MLRIDSEITADRVGALCELAHVKPSYRKALCQHGKQMLQTCRDCEGGYATDHHCFANISGPVAVWPDQNDPQPMVAVCEDHNYVIFVHGSHQDKIDFAYALHVKKRMSK